MANDVCWALLRMPGSVGSLEREHSVDLTSRMPGPDLGIDASRVTFQLMSGLPSASSTVIPGLHINVVGNNCPGGGDLSELLAAVAGGPMLAAGAAAGAGAGATRGRKGGMGEPVGDAGTAAGTAAGAGSGAERAAGAGRWRALLVDGSVGSPEDRSYTLQVNWKSGGGGGGGMGFASEADEREHYAMGVVEAVSSAGGRASHSFPFRLALEPFPP